jgi:hypothetical protein
LVLRVTDLGEGIEQRPGHRFLSDRSREAATHRLPHSTRHERLTPEADPPPYRPRAHRKRPAQPIQAHSRRPVTQDRHQQDQHPEEHLPPEKPQRRRRYPTTAPLRRTAETEPHGTLRSKPPRAAPRLPLVARAVKHSTTPTPHPPRLRREVLVELEQQTKPPGILKQGLVQRVFSFRPENGKRNAPRGRRQAGPRGFNT